MEYLKHLVIHEYETNESGKKVGDPIASIWIPWHSITEIVWRNKTMTINLSNGNCYSIQYDLKKRDGFYRNVGKKHRVWYEYEYLEDTNKNHCACIIE